jgi:Baseplate J-like protein
VIYSCCNDNRKSAVLGNPALNGIDYLEVLDRGAPPGVPRQQTLLIHCVNPLASSMIFNPSPKGPSSATVNVLIEGGESIINIAVDWVIEAAAIDATQPADVLALLPVVNALTDKANVLVVRTHEAGDFSTYCLRLVNSAAQAEQDPFEVTAVMTGFDPQLAAVDFCFKVECGPDFDCAPEPPDCAPPAQTPPPINYLAKDYGSFRTTILDRLNQLLPGWGGSATEADLGVVLAELIAYVGDYLSYQQDAVATEAYLETARRRVSLRRHALLVDYHVHDGCNARAWIQLNVSDNPGDAVFLNRTVTRFYTFAPGMPSSLKVGAGNEAAALLSGVQVFEPMHDAVLYPEHNQIGFYTWGDDNCCLPKGATEASLLGAFPRLVPGDVLIFEEVKGPQTGFAADADLRHRCAVRLTEVAILTDPLFKDGGGNPIQVTEIQWSQADALPFAVCISSTFLDSNNDQQTVTDVSVVLGNVVLADHGLSFSNQPLGTVPGPSLFYPSNPAAGSGPAPDRCAPTPPTPLPVRFRPAIPDSPVTQAVPLAIVPLAGVGNPVTPAVVLFGSGPIDLADSNGFACLTLLATNPAGWPQYFGVVVVPDPIHPPNFDLSVVYNPPGGAAGIHAQVVLEKYANLSLNTADPNYVKTQINGSSKLISVPASYTPPTGPPAGFPAAPTMLANTGSVALQDLSSPAVTYLILEAAAPANWLQLFGVLAQANAQDPTHFDLSVDYDPASGGVGVALPVTVESFTDLSLADAASLVSPGSELITVESFADAPDASLSASALMSFDANAAVPSITLEGVLEGISTAWNPAQDLLESGESAPVFVVEVEADGTATLRFGDDVNGLNPETGTQFTTSYRIGNGTAGNVGADSLHHLAAADARIQSCINPIAATGGIDPETNDQIRRRAPQAFLTQERAVTMADYAAMTELNPQVDRAAAALRWTGSWYTVFDAVEPKGGGNLTPALGKTLKRGLERYRLAGQDLELDSAQYVSLEIALTVCVDPDYFMSDVERALLQLLSNRILPNGQKGLFYPDNFTFGQTVYLSPLYAAARSVEGVLSVAATTFQPQGVPTNRYLDAGEMELADLQIARLDNDRNFPDHGQLTLLMEGGK